MDYMPLAMNYILHMILFVYLKNHMKNDFFIMMWVLRISICTPL